MTTKVDGWIKMSNDVGASDKALELDNYLAGLGLLVCILGYCDRQRTDGYVPRRAIGRAIAPGISGVDEVLDDLVRAGFLEHLPDGYRVHAYLDWQRSAERIKKAQTAASAAAQARWDAERNAERNADGNADREEKRREEKSSARAREEADIRPPTCMTDPRFSAAGGKPVIGLILQAFEDRFGVPAPADLADFWCHVNEGCLHDCPRDRKQLEWCVEHIELKLREKAASTWPRSRVLKMALLDDRRRAQ